MGEETVLLLQQKLESHIEDFKQHCESETARWDKFVATQERNNESIEKLVTSLTSISDLIETWQAVSGAVKVLTALGKFVKWSSGLAVVGVAITWVTQYIKIKF